MMRTCARAGCHNEFIPTFHLRAYCSRECRDAARAEGKREYHKAKYSHRRVEILERQRRKRYDEIGVPPPTVRRHVTPGGRMIVEFQVTCPYEIEPGRRCGQVFWTASRRYRRVDVVCPSCRPLRDAQRRRKPPKPKTPGPVQRRSWKAEPPPPRPVAPVVNGSQLQYDANPMRLLQAILQGRATYVGFGEQGSHRPNRDS